MKINGESLIKILVKKLENSKLVRNVIVGTTNQKTDDEKKHIFIIGGSTLHSINAVYLNEKLSESEINFEVYNLADAADRPTQRLKSIENIINNKPEIVFYGLGYTNFEKFEVKNLSIYFFFYYIFFSILLLLLFLFFQFLSKNSKFFLEFQKVHNSILVFFLLN